MRGAVDRYVARGKQFQPTKLRNVAPNRSEWILCVSFMQNLPINRPLSTDAQPESMHDNARRTCRIISVDAFWWISVLQNQCIFIELKWARALFKGWQKKEKAFVILKEICVTGLLSPKRPFTIVGLGNRAEIKAPWHISVQRIYRGHPRSDCYPSYVKANMLHLLLGNQ